MIDDGEPVDHALGLGEVVRDEEHSAPFGSKFVDHVPEQLATDRVDVVRGLIEDQQARAGDDRRSEPGEPAHPARSRVHGGMAEGLELEPLDEFLGAAASFGLRQAAKPSDQVDEFVDANSLHVELALGKEADVGAGVARLATRSTPSSVMLPPVGLSSPRIWRTRVVLPAPFGPSSP